jgi:hypothetical protein
MFAPTTADAVAVARIVPKWSEYASVKRPKTTFGYLLVFLRGQDGREPHASLLLQVLEPAHSD